MPAGDGTGPEGRGPMTGRSAGYCGGYDAPGWAAFAPGRGFGPRRGRGGVWSGRGGRGGRGGWRRRNWYQATDVPGWAQSGYGPAWEAPADWGYGPYAAEPTREQETEYLKQEAEWLKGQLDAISQRIDELAAEE